ncbi:type II secretion system protein GspI [Vibrio nigripulchritudo]|uniref:type II secretion system minor pseudopilin GspI n=1 Tax=Vibrio nigripulchritudo TaxID=28173 RepID=UPI00190CA66C|nr:type II secretion system minor pseudopilin GspI [Vibrio nigripulchritudo]BCL68203.1 type II secretion system protein GspI [Vibrio nigripulchritudo]BDU29531.1 type II secretion system protein GspI [Vibrio nigripulchritudo]
MKMNRRNARRSRGMTLIEVLVALAIFATAAISVVRAVSQHINTLSFLEEKMFASMVANNQMAKVLLGKAPKKELKGKEELAGQTWYWLVKPVPTDNSVISAFDVSVSGDSEHKSSIVTVRSYASP